MNPNDFMLHRLNKVKGFNVILKSYISIELKFCDKNEFTYICTYFLKVSLGLIVILWNPFKYPYLTLKRQRIFEFCFLQSDSIVPEFFQIGLRNLIVTMVYYFLQL